ncbi:DUF3801 domain-containing protein [Bifidobacterium tibiigranuli]|jgi:hypothetical protein|uniref:DUF3801 domain-containing protein n=1 Tax=Bifidobacterium tibiigranuli TaxID=2172043 RepID=UPI0026E99CD9|nr:DUF3801 domain-containing protein [Bifidobacterium tibiigranuli]MCI1712667.1 PcfB family protein [Bifidobacterium tibiigranuli]
MVDEMIEQAGQRAIMAVMQGTGRIALKLAGKSASQLAHALAETGKWPVRKTRDTIRESINSGNMSEKRLQNLSGGDLHQIQIDDESIREVTKSLKQAGVNYSIEQGPDGTWLHFAGRDNDHIMHAVQRAFNKLNIDFDPEESLEKTTPPNKPEQAKETPESIQVAAEPDTQAIPRQTNQTQAPAAGNPASEQQAQPMLVRENTRPKQAAQAPADRDTLATKRIPVKKTTLKEQFRAQVEQRTKQKLAAQGKPKAPVQKPSRTR